MPSLLELQERFAASLQAIPRSPGMDAYRQSIDANYRRALGASYPVVREIIGHDAFDTAVDAFVAAHPPTSGDLNVYGAGFPAFLQHRHPQQPHLADLARLEWAFDESSRAPESQATPQEVAAALTLLGEEAVGETRLALHPSCRLVATRRAVYATWSSHQQPPGGTRIVAPAARQSEWLMTRREHDRTLVERLTAAEFAWLEALGGGASFAAAIVQALAADAAFDLEQALYTRVHDGTICAVAS